MLDTTIAGVNANSYVTVAEADTYFSLHIDYEKWNEIQNKEKYLVMATKQIDNEIFLFDKYNLQQSLEFPRTNNIDENNNPFIPKKIKEATCEQALFLYLNPDRTLTEIAYSNGYKSVKAGVETFTYSKNPKILSITVQNLLSEYIAKTFGWS